MSNPIPHIHQQMINLWAGDQSLKFQYRSKNDDYWHDCGSSPEWHKYNSYRVKPKVPKYIMAYCDSNDKLGFSANFYKNSEDFVQHNINRNDKWVEKLINTEQMFDE